MDTQVEQLRATWEAQQSIHEPDREQRFATMLAYVGTLAGPPRRVIDLACGPGSITDRVLAEHPDTAVVAVEIDPLHLRLLQATYADDVRVQVLARNLHDPAWCHDLDGGFDAVLTATATHWLPAQTLTRVYADVAHLLRPGGVYANADHMPIGEPVLRGAADRVHQEHLDRAFGAGAESCDDWYARAYALPEYRHLAVERERVFAHWTGDLLQPAAWHLERLQQAGFTTADVVWRRGNDAITVAVR